MPQGGGRSSSSRGRGGSRTPQNNGLDPRIVYAGIGAVALLLIVLIVVLLRGCVSSAPRTRPRRPLLPRRRTRSLLRRPKRSTRTKTPMSRRMSRLIRTLPRRRPRRRESEVTKVKVSVAKGKTAWIEVKVDGKSVYEPGHWPLRAGVHARVLDRDHHVQAFRCHRYQERRKGPLRYQTFGRGACDDHRSQEGDAAESKDGESSDGTDGTDGTESTDTTDGTDTQSTDGADTATDGQRPPILPTIRTIATRPLVRERKHHG